MHDLHCLKASIYPFLRGIIRPQFHVDKLINIWIQSLKNVTYLFKSLEQPVPISGLLAPHSFSLVPYLTVFLVLLGVVHNGPRLDAT